LLNYRALARRVIELNQANQFRPNDVATCANVILKETENQLFLSRDWITERPREGDAKRTSLEGDEREHDYDSYYIKWVQEGFRIVLNYIGRDLRLLAVEIEFATEGSVSNSVEDRVITQRREVLRRIKVSCVPPIVTFDGTAYSVSADAAQLFDAMVSSWPQLVHAKPLNVRPERVENGLPPELRRIFNHRRGQGCTITLHKRASN
jgi:hypothetical protein